MQISRNTDFTDLISNSLDNITYDSFWQQKKIYKSIDIYSSDPDLIQYVRARAENEAGDIYSNWTPTITLSYNNPTNQDYTYSNFPSDYTGVETRNSVYGAIKEEIT